MNSDNYKKAFSNIRPSDESLERIFDMTEKKKRARGFKKGLIVVIAVLSVLMCGALTANAATDGAIAQTISEGINSIKLIINGKEVETDKYISNVGEYVDDNGRTVSEYEISIPDEDAKIDYEIVKDNDGVEFNMSAEGVKGEIQIETNDFIEPTTSENK